MISLCSVQPPAYYFQMVEPYRDKFGLITQTDPSMDGGDAAHRTGVFYYGMYLQYKNNPEDLKKVKTSFLADFNKLRVGPGQYVRHPDSTMWYSNPENFSRDQTTPLVIALGAFQETTELTANFKKLIDSHSFYPNKLKNWTNEEKIFPFDYRDIAGPSDWGMYIRALKKQEYYPALYLTDWQLFGNALTRIVISHFDDHDASDDINYTLLLLQAKETRPTFISDLTLWLYTHFRKVNPFTKKIDNQNGVASAWEYYFTYVKERPPLHKVYECTLNSFDPKESETFDDIQNFVGFKSLRFENQY